MRFPFPERWARPWSPGAVTLFATIAAWTVHEPSVAVTKEVDGVRVKGRIVSREYESRGGGIERSIVSVWKLPQNKRVARNYSEGEPFEFRLPPGQYRLLFSANGARGATFQTVAKRIAVTEHGKPVRVGVIDLPITKTTRLYGRAAPEIRGIVDWKHTRPRTLKQLRGKIVVLDFWAHYCSICHAHKPDLAKLYAKYRQQGLEVLTIHNNSLASMDAVDERMKKVPRYETLHLPIALDCKGKQSVFAAYGISGVPAVILIDRQGKVVRRFHHAGKPELAQEIGRLVGKPQANRAELEQLATIGRPAAHEKTNTGAEDPANVSQQFSNQVVRGGAFARVVSVKRLPQPLPNDYSFGGYIVDRLPKWAITLKVEQHDRKIPMSSGIRRYYIADLKAIFLSDDVSKIVGGRYRFSFTWHTGGKTGPEQIQNFRALRVERENGKSRD